jgi:hypothetical protein
MNLIILSPWQGISFEYAIKDLILALWGEKAYFECQILFSHKESDLKKIFLEA